MDSIKEKAASPPPSPDPTVSPTDPQEIDSSLVSRLFLGALSEHEQRLVAVRLLSLDETFRRGVCAVVEPFEMFDLDLAQEYSRALREGRDVESRRRKLLVEAYHRAPDLEELLRHFTYSDLLSLGDVTRRLFTWSTAEMLMERSRRVALPEHEARTSLYLAQMVIDTVEILGAAGHSPCLPEVVRDVRQRLREAVVSIWPAKRRA